MNIYYYLYRNHRNKSRQISLKQKLLQNNALETEKKIKYMRTYIIITLKKGNGHDIYLK